MACFPLALILCIMRGVAGSTSVPNSGVLLRQGAKLPLNATDTPNATDAGRSLQRLQRIDANAADLKMLNQRLDQLQGMLKQRNTKSDKRINGILATVTGLTDTLTACTQESCNAGQLTAHGMTLVGNVAMATSALQPAGPILVALGGVLALIFGSSAEPPQPGITLEDIKGAIFSELTHYGVSKIIEVKFPTIAKGRLAGYMKRLGSVVNYLESEASAEEKQAYLTSFLNELTSSINPGLQLVEDAMISGYQSVMSLGSNSHDKSFGVRGQLLAKTTFQDTCETKCPSVMHDDWTNSDFKKGQRRGWDDTCLTDLGDSGRLLRQFREVLHGYRDLALQILSIRVLLDMVYNLAGWDVPVGVDAAAAKGPKEAFELATDEAAQKYHTMMGPSGLWKPWSGEDYNILEELDHYCEDVYTPKQCNCAGKTKYHEMLDGKCKCDYEEFAYVPPGCNSMCREKDGAVFFATTPSGKHCEKSMDRAKSKLDRKVAGSCGIPCGWNSGIKHMICARRKGCAYGSCTRALKWKKW